MKMIPLVALLLVYQLQSQAAPSQSTAQAQATASRRSAPTGDARAGKAFWEQPTTFCPVCHGDRGQGAYGPDLAGRRLSVAQFRRQVRQSWGVMPRWTPEQISDRTLADVHAYLSNLRPVDKLGRGRHRCPATRRSICVTSSRRMAAGSAMARTWKPYSLARRMPRWILPGSPGRFTTTRPISLRAGWEVFQETACPSRCCASCGTPRSRRCARERRPRRPVRPSHQRRRQNQPTPRRQNQQNEGENGRVRIPDCVIL